MVIPIYRDTVFSYSGTELTYSVVVDGETILNGKAYAAPGGTSVDILINRICEPYLSNNNIEPILNGSVSGVSATSTALRTFHIYSGETELESYQFIYCYDYETEYMYTQELSDPITDAYATNMIPVRTYYNDVGAVMNYGNSEHYTRGVCGAEYCLYYLNAKGGWDAFVIEGNSEKTDKIDRHQYNKSYNNQTIEYEKNTYISEITSSWKLTTGILTDDQAKKMCWHLLGSIRVYLHDLKENKIIPVVITNQQNVYRTYKNSGKHPIQYEIQLTESQMKIRQ